MFKSQETRRLQEGGISKELVCENVSRMSEILSAIKRQSDQPVLVISWIHEKEELYQGSCEVPCVAPTITFFSPIHFQR